MDDRNEYWGNPIHLRSFKWANDGKWRKMMINPDFFICFPFFGGFRTLWHNMTQPQAKFAACLRLCLHLHLVGGNPRGLKLVKAHHLPSGILTVCYGKWPSSIRFTMIYLLKVVMFNNFFVCWPEAIHLDYNPKMPIWMPCPTSALLADGTLGRTWRQKWDVYPLVICYSLLYENGHLEWIYQLKIVIFHSYVSLPEGISKMKGLKYVDIDFIKMGLTFETPEGHVRAKEQLSNK